MSSLKKLSQFGLAGWPASYVNIQTNIYTMSKELYNIDIDMVYLNQRLNYDFLAIT